MTDKLIISLAQINPIVGDIDGNINLIKDARKKAERDQAELVVMGELCVCGYPPEDLVRKSLFLEYIESFERRSLKSFQINIQIVSFPAFVCLFFCSKRWKLTIK